MAPTLELQCRVPKKRNENRTQTNHEKAKRWSAHAKGLTKNTREYTPTDYARESKNKTQVSHSPSYSNASLSTLRSPPHSSLRSHGYFHNNPICAISPKRISFRFSLTITFPTKQRWQYFHIKTYSAPQGTLLEPITGRHKPVTYPQIGRAHV